MWELAWVHVGWSFSCVFLGSTRGGLCSMSGLNALSEGLEPVGQPSIASALSLPLNLAVRPTCSSCCEVA